jgi:serine protease AprX
VIGIVDSGTTKDDVYLSAWRDAREIYVPESEQDTSHGSFVAGLVVHGQRLNHADKQFPSCSARFVDIVALSKKGTTEDKLLATLEDAIVKFPTVKIWNLSLGTGATVSDRSFSDLAVALDRLQREHKVTFVVAAGNYPKPPYRGWPPEDLGDADRICAPADSLRSIVVGSLAHREHTSTRVKAGDPSPFSRRGPGPLYLPKPDISHVGGNCDAKGVCTQVGVLSMDGKGNLAEDLGTSFATPLVSTLFANLSQRISGQTSLLMAKALLIHSAAMEGRKIDPAHLRYRGFGVPPDIDVALACAPWQCTMTFELEIPQSVAYEKTSFPMPKSLFTNSSTLKANILMTLVHDPEMDASFGSEYCRSNIEVSLGTHDPGKDGKLHQKKQVPEDPKLGGKAYEKDLVEHGFKWSPVKVYRREMVKGVKGKNWRLDLSVHHRSAHTPTKPNRAALVVTISDPGRKEPVYNEMVSQMNKLGWTAVDLQVKSRIRTQRR